MIVTCPCGHQQLGMATRATIDTLGAVHHCAFGLNALLLTKPVIKRTAHKLRTRWMLSRAVKLAGDTRTEISR